MRADTDPAPAFVRGSPASPKRFGVSMPNERSRKGQAVKSIITSICGAAVFLALLMPGLARAEAVQLLGFGRLFSNDLIGDGYNRWQSSSSHASLAFRRSPWTGTLPKRPFDIVELRFNATVMTPDNLRERAPGDRRMAGLLRLGIGTQFEYGGWENDLAAYVEYVGPDNGLVDLFTGFQDISEKWTNPSKNLRDDQIDLPPQLGLSLETGRTFIFGTTRLRPFLAMETGIETLARVGADLTFGSYGVGGLLTRSRVSGQRYGIATGPEDGVSVVLGGDVTWVEQTQLLEESDGVDVLDHRTRLRTGLHWQRGTRHVFYGVTWVSPETAYQDHGQTIGSLRLDWIF